jgi:hypothetical protein
MSINIGKLYHIIYGKHLFLTIIGELLPTTQVMRKYEYTQEAVVSLFFLSTATHAQKLRFRTFIPAVNPPASLGSSLRGYETLWSIGYIMRTADSKQHIIFVGWRKDSAFHSGSLV